MAVLDPDQGQSEEGERSKSVCSLVALETDQEPHSIRCLSDSRPKVNHRGRGQTMWGEESQSDFQRKERLTDSTNRSTTGKIAQALVPGKDKPGDLSASEDNVVPTSAPCEDEVASAVASLSIQDRNETVRVEKSDGKLVTGPSPTKRTYSATPAFPSLASIDSKPTSTDPADTFAASPDRKNQNRSTARTKTAATANIPTRSGANDVLYQERVTTMPTLLASGVVKADSANPTVPAPASGKIETLETNEPKSNQQTDTSTKSDTTAAPLAKANATQKLTVSKTETKKLDTEPPVSTTTVIANVETDKAQDGSTATQVLDQITNDVATLAIQPRASDRLCGSDIPVNAVMKVWAIRGGAKTEFKMVVLHPGSWKPVFEIPIFSPRPTCAVALLDRGPGEPLWVSVSGWAKRAGANRDYQVDCAEWVPKVRRMCREMGYSLNADWRDQGIKGRFEACHAEMQMLAFLYFGRFDLPLVRIHVSFDTCPRCIKFVEFFVAATKMCIQVFVKGVRTLPLEKKKAEVQVITVTPSR